MEKDDSLTTGNVTSLKQAIPEMEMFALRSKTQEIGVLLLQIGSLDQNLWIQA